MTRIQTGGIANRNDAYPGAVPSGFARRYSIGAIIVMLGFAASAAKDAGRIEAGRATPWVGLIERVSYYSWHVWFIVLALRMSAAKLGQS